MALEPTGLRVRLMWMSRGALLLLMAFVVTVGACGGRGSHSSQVEPVSTVDRETGAAIGGGDGVWERSTAVLVTSGIRTQSDLPPESPEVQVLGSTSAGYLAAGSVNGGFVVWRSDDLVSFEPVYSEICCERNLRAASIGELGATLLIGGTEFVFGSDERAFLLRSDDAGVSWAPVDHPSFGSDANRVDQLVVIGDVAIAELVDDRNTGAQPRSMPVWSEDLETWQPVELPGRLADDWPSFLHDHDNVYAVTRRTDRPDGDFSTWAIWRSDDGGRTFTESRPLQDSSISGFIVVRGALVGVPTTYRADDGDSELRGLARLDTDGTWRVHPAGTGTWGDGFVGLQRGASAVSTDRTYVLVSRTLRASEHYCFDDVDTCQVHEVALLATDNGIEWSDVADFPPPTHLYVGPMSLTVEPNGDVVFLTTTDRDRVVYVTRWTGTGIPAEVTRPNYPSPEAPVPLYEHARPLDIGDERRYLLGLGGCGGMYIDGQLWEPATPLPVTPPASWPLRVGGDEGGPTSHVFGRVHRLTDDTIEFSIEGIGPIATFHPAPPPEFSCE